MADPFYLDVTFHSQIVGHVPTAKEHNGRVLSHLYTEANRQKDKAQLQNLQHQSP
jgi:hypothetical protein